MAAVIMPFITMDWVAPCCPLAFRDRTLLNGIWKATELKQKTKNDRRIGCETEGRCNER